MKILLVTTAQPLWFKYILATTLYSTALLGLPALAQDDTETMLEMLYGDEETVSIATGSNKPLRLAPSVASVITADDIRAMGANDLDDVLQSVPGLHVSLSQRYSSKYSFRGIHTNYNPQVLMLVNGYPITDLYLGTRLQTLRLSINNIKRVEVIRGPGSAVYGADAFAGTINIITYDATDYGNGKVGATVGSFDTSEGWVQGSTERNGWHIGLSLEWLKSDGDTGRRIEADLQSVFDGFFGTNSSLAPGAVTTYYDLFNGQLQFSNQYWKITVNSLRQDDAGIGSGIADALDSRGHQYGEQHLLDVQYNDPNFADSWQIEARTNYFYMKQHAYFTIFPPGSVLPIGTAGNITEGNLDFNPSTSSLVSFPDGYIGNPGALDKSLSADLIFFYTGMKKHRLRYAFGYKAQDEETTESKNFGPGVIDGAQPVVDGTLTDVTGTPFIFSPNSDRDIYYLSVQDEWSFLKDWELTAGLRFDDYSDFGRTINPRAAFVWQTTYSLTTKLLYGRAFRAPSFSEQFSINNPIILGNPDLDPEEIDTLEVSFNYRPSYNVDTQLNIFNYKIDGLIDYVPDVGGSGTSTAQNTTDQSGSGFELEANWSISDMLSLSGSYSWQHSEDDDSGQEIPNAPQQLIYLDLRWQFIPHWYFSSQLNHVADRSRVSTDIRADIDDYTLLNLSVYTEKLSKNWNFSFVVHNVLDKEAFEPGTQSVPGDHPLEGRSIMLHLGYKFSDN